MKKYSKAWFRRKQAGVALTTDQAKPVIKKVSLSAQLRLTGKVMDPVFYSNYYADLKNFSEEELSQHWQQYGMNEERFPNIRSFLDFNGVNADVVPHDFDVDTYQLLNPEVASLNYYDALLSYFKSGSIKNKEYIFDYDFYINYYADLKDVISGKSQAIAHWLEHGRREGRHASLKSLLAAEGLKLDLIPDGFDITEFYRLNPSSRHLNYWTVIIEVLRQDPTYPYFINANDKENFAFYKNLGQHYLGIGNFDKAVDVLQVSYEFGRDAKVSEYLGNISTEKGDFEGAISYYQDSLANGTDSAWVYYNISNAYLKSSRYETAIEMAIEGIVEFPDFQPLQNLQHEITTRFWNYKTRSFTALALIKNRTRLIEKVKQAAAQISSVRESQLMVQCNKEKETNFLLNSNKVLIIGDYHVPQCVRYRINQKIEQLEIAGYEATSVSWTDPNKARNLLLFNDIIIFYRVPSLPDIIDIITTAKVLGKITIYEIDDLLFEECYPPPLASYGGQVSMAAYRDLTVGMAYFRTAASLCDYGLASTKPLATRLQSLVKKKLCYVHRNALDSSNFIPTAYPAKPDKGYINIFYGSGTLAHNTDFLEEALPSLEKILEEFDNVKLTVVGHLALPNYFVTRYREQIVQLPLIKNLKTYWAYIEASDINIAVLKNDIINDCKSELKWLEAGCLGVPSIVSYTENYNHVIKHGEDGLVVRKNDDWYVYLKDLIASSSLREKIGRAAYMRVISEYSAERLSANIKAIIEDILYEHT